MDKAVDKFEELDEEVEEISRSGISASSHLPHELIRHPYASMWGEADDRGVEVEQGPPSPSPLSDHSTRADERGRSRPSTATEDRSNAATEHGQSSWPPAHSPWYIYTRRYIYKIRGGEVEARDGKEISPHHRPFTPYVERSTEPASHSIHWPKVMAIHIETIRCWLRTCKQRHGPQCGDLINPKEDLPNDPLLVIDAVNNCLTSVALGTRYIALSYVWGNGSASSCTTKGNLPLFRQKNGLVKNRKTLPKVVHQALEIVRGLGENYLWVDRFCIVQDDLEPKLRQLNAMGQVYAGAYFTLIAAGNNDAAHGLYGKRRMSFENHDRTPVIAKGSNPERLLLEQAYRLMQTKWHTRGEPRS